MTGHANMKGVTVPERLPRQEIPTSTLRRLLDPGHFISRILPLAGAFSIEAGL